MQARLKIHSTLNSYFEKTEYKIDLATFADVIPYLSAMHPKFKHYMTQIEYGESQESFCILDKDLNIVDEQMLFIKKVKDGDTIYIAPAIVGGSGKRGLLIAAAFAIVAGPAIAAQFATAGSGTAVAGIGVGGAGEAALIQNSVAASSSTSIFSGLGGFAMRIAGNLGMALLSSLFVKKPKQPQQRDTNTRENSMFGSLQNSVQSGTPIPLIYGHHRVAGQMISGYLDSEVHGKTDIIKVSEKF